MDALPSLVAALMPDVCCPQPTSVGLPDATTYARVARVLGGTTAVIVDASSAAHRLAAGIDQMPLDAFAGELWQRTVSEVVALPAVKVVVLVFANAAASAAAPMRKRRISAAVSRDMVARGRFAQKYTASSAAAADWQALCDAVVAFIVAGHADVGAAHVIVHGLTPTPMCLGPDADSAVRDATVWQEAAAAAPSLGLALPADMAAATDADTAVAAWARVLAAHATLVVADDVAVLAALMVYSVLSTTVVARGTLTLLRPHGITVPVRSDAPAATPPTAAVPRAACSVAQYINVHAAVMGINALLAPALVEASVVGARDHGVLALLALALCHSHEFSPATWFMRDGGLCSALTEMVAAATERRLGQLVSCDDATGAVSVRVAGVDQLAAAVEPAGTRRTGSGGANAQAARLALWLARLTQASRSPGWRVPDARAVNDNSGRSVWGYAADGSFTDSVDVRLVHVCGGGGGGGGGGVTTA